MQIYLTLILFWLSTFFVLLLSQNKLEYLCIQALIELYCRFRMHSSLFLICNIINFIILLIFVIFIYLHFILLLLWILFTYLIINWNVYSRESCLTPCLLKYFKNWLIWFLWLFIIWKLLDVIIEYKLY